MSPVLEKIRRFFQRKESQVPEDRDELGAYPLRMQISAIPERRYLRTARLLTILSFVNMAIMIVLAGLFTYNAVRIDTSVGNRRAVNLYAIDPENKVLQASEYDETTIPAMTLMLEQAFHNYLEARFTVNLDPQKQQKYWGRTGALEQYTNPKLLETFKKKLAPYMISTAQARGVNQEVHIYSLHQTPGGTWEALLDVFDMRPRNPYNPICDCDDNTPACISCKAENSLGRHRYRVFLRGLPLRRQPTLYNPLGIMVDGVHVVPQPINPGETFWGLPPELRPGLE